MCAYMLCPADIFPTIVELTRLPALPKCEGVDQPPSVLCLQGESFASEFMDATAQALTSHARPSTAPPKQYVLSTIVWLCAI